MAILFWVMETVDVVSFDVMICCKVEGIVVFFVGLTRVVALDTVVCATDEVVFKGSLLVWLVDSKVIVVGTCVFDNDIDA